MSLPGNGIFVVQGEMAMLVTAMKRSSRWNSHTFNNEEYDVLMRTFQELKTILTQVEDLRLLDPTTFLSPFLEVIRSKETTGPVTSLALTAINKFLSYGLIDPTHASVPTTVEDIADAVTHARFVGTDHSSDGVVLMRILQVLRTLMLSPEGAMLTDESVCEIMLSCFRICFETRLSELLRKNAEQCLRDMTQLIFMRLPQFSYDETGQNTSINDNVGLSLRKREKSAKKSRASGINQVNGQISNEKNLSTASYSTTPSVDSSSSSKVLDMQGNILQTHDDTKSSFETRDTNELSEAEITIELPSQSKINTTRSPSKKHTRHSSMDLASNGNSSITQLLEKCVNHSESVESEKETQVTENVEVEEKQEINSEEGPGETEALLQEGSKEASEESEPVSVETTEGPVTKQTETLVRQLSKEEYVNPRGIRFTTQEEPSNLQPYGLVCVRELFRFLISLCNPIDTQNTSAMVQLGLCLVGTALEVGADHLAKYPSLLHLVKDPLCRNLLSLLNSDRILIFGLDLQISFLLYESLRVHLKFQMEAFFNKLIDIISADSTKSTYENKEITHLALESLTQMFSIPGLCTELYLNYDCDIYCKNLFEEITKLLSKNVVSSTSYETHLLSLEALMTIIDAIEMNINQNKIAPKNMTEIVEPKVEETVKDANVYRSGHVCLELGGLDDASVMSDTIHDISQYLGCAKMGRHKPSKDLPTEQELEKIKVKKRCIATGTEIFNQKADKGIEYLQEHGLLDAPLEPKQVAAFLRENPGLDKKMIGDYICKRSTTSVEGGPTVLSAFADSFEYRGLRIDQALRLYLETFRLPGEAPLIFLVMEHFADRWHNCNGRPFENTDAAFRLAYSIIMLNMDQHNHNAKKLNVPMTSEDFVRNLRGCNGTGDFDQTILEAIYNSIKNEEIVMPAERSGIVRENYLWKVLLRRGLGPGGKFLSAPISIYDDQLFAVVWGPTVAALSSAFEKAPAPSIDELDSGNPNQNVTFRALAGFEQCAAIVAHRKPDADSKANNEEALTLDTLVLGMCKFTGLLSLPENANYITIGTVLGQSTKSLLALRRACAVMARHADVLRDSWKNLLELVKALYIGRLLPKALTDAEDFLAPSGKISLIREPTGQNRAAETGLFSSLYSYISLSEPSVGSLRAPTRYEKAAIDIAVDCVSKCNLSGILVIETKFLQLCSLQELVKHIIAAGTPPEREVLQQNPDIEDNVIFFLELLLKIVIQNKDRVSHIWPEVSAHFIQILYWGSALTCEESASQYAAERAVTTLLRAAARLMRNEECASAVLASLKSLLELPYKVFYKLCERISSGLYELVRTSAQNVHSAADWELLFTLLEAAGAGAWRTDGGEGCTTPTTGYYSASSRSDGAASSEDESSYSAGVRSIGVASETDLSNSPATQGWILVGNNAAAKPTVADTALIPDASLIPPAAPPLRAHRLTALAKCTECLTLVVRDVAHVTPYNFAACVACVRIFVEASLHGGKKLKSQTSKEEQRRIRLRGHSKQQDSDEEDDTRDGYYMVSTQLLDLMHTLHSRTAQIFSWWQQEAGLLGEKLPDQTQGEEDLWEVAWMPLLQGIARLCTDRRKQVSNSAIAYLQRALLAPGLQSLGGAGWEACFSRVLFPLMDELQQRHSRQAAVEITARANTIMCKVFLHHLTALSARSTFGGVWLRVVALQQRLVADAGRSPAADTLREAALESLKNMILVMDSVNVFSNGDGYSDLWYVTWERIAQFLPQLKEELFPQPAEIKKQVAPPPQQTEPPPQRPPMPPARNPLYQQPPTPGASIILQPPLGQTTQPVFSHLGQMVSTPIGFAVPVAQTNPSTVPLLYTSPQPIPAPVPGTVLYQHLPSVESPHIQQGVQSPFTLVGQSTVPLIKSPSDTNTPSSMPPPTSTYNMQQQNPAREPIMSLHSDLPTNKVSNFQSSSTSTKLYESCINTAINVENSPQKQPDSIYNEYLTNPYNDAKELSPVEATIYTPPKELSIADRLDRLESQMDSNSNFSMEVDNAMRLQKSVSVTSSPMHAADHKTLSHNTVPMFSSSDNIQNLVRQSEQPANVYNFVNFFNSDTKDVSGSYKLFEDLSTQEG